MGKLTTHVLDTAHGKPGAGIAVALYRMNGYDRQFVSGHTTNADGRCDQPLLDGMAIKPGVYELDFEAGEDIYRRHLPWAALFGLTERWTRVGRTISKVEFDVKLVSHVSISMYYQDVLVHSFK